MSVERWPRRRLRESVKKRVAAAQKWRCMGVGVVEGGCSGALLPSTYQVHHRSAWALTANDDVRNLVAMCPSCHAVHTQREHAWILLARRVAAVRTSYRLCPVCKRVTSTYWDHVCGGGWVEGERVYVEVGEWVRRAEGAAANVGSTRACEEHSETQYSVLHNAKIKNRNHGRDFAKAGKHPRTGSPALYGHTTRRPEYRARAHT